MVVMTIVMLLSVAVNQIMLVMCMFKFLLIGKQKSFAMAPSYCQ